MKIQKKIAVAGLVVAALGSMSACRMGKTSVVLKQDLKDDEVFQIENTVCKLPEAKVYLCNYQNIYGSAYGINLWKHETSDKSLEQYVKDITISELARIACMDEMAKEQEIVLTAEEEAWAKKAAKTYYDSLTEEELAYMGIGEKQLEDMYRNYALAQKLYTALTKSINEEVSDDDARVMEAQQIYVTTEERANEVKKALRKGKDFLAVATDYNEAGKIAVTFGRGDMPVAVEEAAFNIEDEEITDCIAADEGFYFIKCTNKFNQELTDERKLTIVKERETEAFDRTYEEFVAEHESVLNIKLWEQIMIEHQEQIVTDSFFEVYDTYFSKK